MFLQQNGVTVANLLKLVDIHFCVVYQVFHHGTMDVGQGQGGPVVEGVVKFGKG